MGVTGDFARADRLAGAFAAMSADARGLTSKAMVATQDATDDSFARESTVDAARWAPLAPSTLRRRPPGPILRGLQSDLLWTLHVNGRWSVRSRQKPYAVYHLGPDKRTGRPARPYLPQTPAEAQAVAERVGRAVALWQLQHLQAAR